MRIHRLRFLLSATAAMMLALVAAPVSADTIIDDNFDDGNRLATGPLQANFFTTSSTSAIEDDVDDGIGTGAIGLVSGTSGRQIHAIFPAQTLATAGDSVSATITFTTPGIVASTATATELADAITAAQAIGSAVDLSLIHI